MNNSKFSDQAYKLKPYDVCHCSHDTSEHEIYFSLVVTLGFIAEPGTTYSAWVLVENDNILENALFVRG